MILAADAVAKASTATANITGLAGSGTCCRISGSGLAGYGMNNRLREETTGRLHICGDQETEANQENGLISARAAIVANMEANKVIELLMEKGE